MCIGFKLGDDASGDNVSGDNMYRVLVFEYVEGARGDNV